MVWKRSLASCFVLLVPGLSSSSVNPKSGGSRLLPSEQNVSGVRQASLGQTHSALLKAELRPSPGAELAENEQLAAGNSTGARIWAFSSVDPRLRAETRRSKLICAQILGALVVAALAPVLVYQGWSAFIALSTLLLSLTLVQVAMKAALHNGLPYPYTLTAIHMLLTMLTALAAGPPARREWQMALQTLPASVAGGAAVLLHNVALTQASVSFVTMLGSCTPVVTYCVEFFMGHRQATWKSGVPVLMAWFGGALCVRGERNASMLALLLVLLGCASRSAKSIWQQQLLSIDQLGPARLAAWGAAWTLLLTLPFAIVEEGAGFFRRLPSASKHAVSATLLSCVAAVLLNLSQWTSVRYLGPVMQHMFGNLQLVFVLILAAVWLDEGCSGEQLLGTFVLVMGVLIAKASPVEKRTEERPLGLRAKQQGYLATKPNPTFLDKSLASSHSQQGFPRPIGL
ncbi:unnamed protein product [Durusdinium trenchii]|uniref:Sugar phosphate transporter domain-containing protein n=1 Tax=Durusdinium trenchii TaxID=1381693 RepID=A0ABP0NU97_9DINO